MTHHFPTRLVTVLGDADPCCLFVANQLQGDALFLGQDEDPDFGAVGRLLASVPSENLCRLEGLTGKLLRDEDGGTCRVLLVDPPDSRPT